VEEGGRVPAHQGSQDQNLAGLDVAFVEGAISSGSQAEEARRIRYHNNLAQAIEVLQCVDEANDILSTTRMADEEPVRRPAQTGTGMGVIEAPRGLLYHMARVDEEGVVQDYDVIVPTAQNQINIENDLRDCFSRNLQRGEDALRMNAESIIRAYDPCMSCATNFLKIDWTRE
jgi:sulfhydrogenase subunit alpha